MKITVGIWAFLGWIAVTACAAEIDFARDVQPVLAQSCVSCHGPKSQLGGLRLDAKTTAMAGGQSGKVIVAGKAGGQSAATAHSRCRRASPHADGRKATAAG